MIGKYSPTVNIAYADDQDWHKKYSKDEQYDPEGYDSYGYNKDGIDRAGNEEDFYSICDACEDSYDDNFYDRVHAAWSFDGIKPVKMY
jgi:hypothetical protein